MSRLKNQQMHRTLLPKISVLILICLFLVTVPAVGQAIPEGEIDVTKCWSYPIGEKGTGLISDGSRVFLGSTGANVEALSFDGKKMWSSELGGEISSNILPLDNSILLVTSSVSSNEEKSVGSVLRSLSKETGITNFTLKLPDAERHFLSGFKGSVIVISKNGVIQSIDTKSGGVKWKREIAEGFAGEPVFTVSKVLSATTGKQIFGISLVSGEIDSMRKVPYNVASLGETASGEIIVGDDRGNISSLIGSLEKPYWKFKTGGQISHIFAIGEYVLAASHDNFVYYFQSRNGDVTWKKRLSGRVLQVGNIMDRFALITSFDENGAVFTDLSNGKVAGRIAFGEGEIPVFQPSSFNGMIFVLTNRAAYAYSLNGCAAK